MPKMEGTAKTLNLYKLSGSNGSWPLSHQLEEDEKNGNTRLAMIIRYLRHLFSSLFSLAAMTWEKQRKKGLLEGGHPKLGTIADLGPKQTGWPRFICRTHICFNSLVGKRRYGEIMVDEPWSTWLL